MMKLMVGVGKGKSDIFLDIDSPEFYGVLIFHCEFFVLSSCSGCTYSRTVHVRCMDACVDACGTSLRIRIRASALWMVVHLCECLQMYRTSTPSDNTGRIGTAPRVRGSERRIIGC